MTTCAPSAATAKDLAAREQMALAATYAGLAFTRANVGYVHAIAHQLGGKYHTPHGLANAIVLPHVLRFLARRSPGGWPLLAVRAGVGKEGERPAALAKKFLDSVDALNRDIGIPAQAGRAARGGHPRAGQGRLLGGGHQLPGAALHVAATCAEILREVLPATGRRSLPAGAARAEPVAAPRRPRRASAGTKATCLPALPARACRSRAPAYRCTARPAPRTCP